MTAAMQPSGKASIPVITTKEEKDFLGLISLSSSTPRLLFFDGSWVLQPQLNNFYNLKRFHESYIFEDRTEEEDEKSKKVEEEEPSMRDPDASKDVSVVQDRVETQKKENIDVIGGTVVVKLR
ncbi:hypothetical protein Q3G72_012516 [Acer saccharum]|nr:hypothetical protein Q3G72_012516 [Acer saccharum]